MPLRRQMRSAISRANGSMLEVMILEVLDRRKMPGFGPKSL
jgi:hypothetical protein